MSTVKRRAGVLAAAGVLASGAVLAAATDAKAVTPTDNTVHLIGYAGCNPEGSFPRPAYKVRVQAANGEAIDLFPIGTGHYASGFNGSQTFTHVPQAGEKAIAYLWCTPLKSTADTGTWVQITPSWNSWENLNIQPPPS